MAKPAIYTSFNVVDKMTGVIKRMNKSVSGFSRNTKKSFRGVGASIGNMRGLLTGALTIFTSGAIAKGITSFAKSGDEIAKTARQIGLSAEALQELRFAADRSGVSSEKFSDAMKKLNKNVGDLRAGTGMLTTYLNKSNPKLKEQLKNAKSNEEAFNLLTDALSKIKNPMDRAALAQAAFGRSGQDLIIMTENGVDGIEALRKEARAYGGVISNDAAKKSEKFVDSLTNMKASLNGLKNNALIPLMNQLQPLIDRTTKWISKNKELIGLKINNVFSAINKTIGITVSLWESGLLPAVLGGLAAYKTITLAIITYKGIQTALTAATEGTTVATWSLNAAFKANPIGLIITGVTLLIAGIVLLVKHWDTVKRVAVDTFKTVRDWIFKAFDNPIVQGIGMLFAPFITIPILIAKNWGKVKDTILNVWEKIKAPFNAIKGFFTKENKANIDVNSGQVQANAALGIPMSPNANVIQSNSTVTHNWQGNLNIKGVPAGSTFKQSGTGIVATMETGYAARGF